MTYDVPPDTTPIEEIASTGWGDEFSDDEVTPGKLLTYGQTYSTRYEAKKPGEIRRYQVTLQLRMDGWPALSIHGDKSQDQRDTFEWFFVPIMSLRGRVGEHISNEVEETINKKLFPLFDGFTSKFLNQMKYFQWNKKEVSPLDLFQILPPNNLFPPVSKLPMISSECEALGLNDFPTAETLQWHGYVHETSAFDAFTLV
ncbi:hypothetical protein Tco_0145283 [Tanacetum coccineum]